MANIIGGGTPDTSNPLYWNGDIDWFTPTEVGESKYVNESKRKITYAGLKSSSAKLLPRGSILLSTRASVGLASITTNPRGVTTNQGFQSVVPKRVEDSEFLYYVVSNQNTQRKLKTKANGSTFPEISNSEVSSIIVSLPPDPKERFEISRFLATIDQRIRLQNKIIEELLTLKKALYNKVFGTDAFNCRDVTLYQFMKMPDNVREMRPDRNKLITVRLNEGGVIKNTNVETLKMASTIYYRRSAGQFIYGKQNIFHGAFGIVPCHLDGYASSGDVPALDFKEGVNSSFLMRSMSFSCYSWEKYASGTGSKRIHEKSLLELQVRMPSSGYVERLEKMFAALEQRVERNRRTLNLYLTQKRYLLSQLFI